MVYWVETKGKTLEEMDAIFEGEKHSDVPDVEKVRKGEVVVDTALLEQELYGGKDSKAEVLVSSGRESI